MLKTSYNKMFDVVNVSFNDTTGSQQSGVRPAVVVQNSIGNKYSPTIIVIPLTSNLKKPNQPTHYILNKGIDNKLKCNSMVLAEQVRVISKENVHSTIGHINNLTDQNGIMSAYIANLTGYKVDTMNLNLETEAV